MRCSTHPPVFALLCALAVCREGRSQSLREAAQLDAEGKCAEADQQYRTLLARGWPSAALLNNAANHYLVCGEPGKAETYFRKLIGINPRHSNANLQLARLSAERKRGAEALAYLARVNDTSPQVSLVRAEALFWAGRRSAATAELDSVATAAAGNAEVLFLIGVTSARLGLFERSEAAFTRALALRPGDFDLTLGLGRAAARAKHYDRAQRALEAALRLQPDDVNTLVELGRVCAARLDYVCAVFHLARARKKAPGNPEILLLLARAAEDAGYYEDACSAYDGYLEIKPADETGRRDRAGACGQTESRLQQARSEIDSYIAKHPADAQGHYIAAQIVWGTAPEQALKHLTQAVRLDPASVSIRYSRAWMLQRAGLMAESLPDLEAAHRLAPENARILDLMGLAHLALDRPAQAEKVLRLALAKAPQTPEVILHLGRALMALGREAEAQSYMEQYRTIRHPGLPGLRKREGMIELATLGASEQRRREIDRFRQQSRDHPDRPDYQLHLATLLLTDGQKQDAMREFERLLTLNASAQVCAEAGSLLLTAGEFSRAQSFLERAAKERPAAQLDLAIATFHTSGPDAAVQVLDRLIGGELAGDALLLEADILAASGRRPEAEKALEAGLRHSPAQPRVVERAVPLLIRLDRKADALNLVEEALRRDPLQSDLLIMKAVVLALMDRTAAAEKTVNDVEFRFPEWERPYLVHGLICEKSGRTKDAREKLQTAAALGSKHAALTCALARLGGNTAVSPDCACSTGLEQMLFNTCAP